MPDGRGMKKCMKSIKTHNFSFKANCELGLSTTFTPRKIKELKESIARALIRAGVWHGPNSYVITIENVDIKDFKVIKDEWSI